MTAELDLKTLAREVIDQDTSEDLAQMTKELRRRIPADAIGEALDQALVPFVHAMIRQPTSGRQQPRPSAKVTGIREAWRRQLDKIRYTVEDGSIRRIGDMSHDDLIFVAEGLEALAAQHQARATQIRELAGAMAEQHAGSVRDLPDDMLRPLFERPAA